MARVAPDGAQQIISTAVLEHLGPWLAAYGHQADLTLLTDAEWPLPLTDYQHFWCLTGPDLALVITIERQSSPTDQALVQLLLTDQAVEDWLQQLQSTLDSDQLPAIWPTLRHRLGKSTAAAQARFMLGWLQFCAQASQTSTCEPVQARLDQQLERSLLLNQVVTKIQESLDLSVILQTTVAEVRQFLQADRLLIYQFNPGPQHAAEPNPDAVGLGDQPGSTPSATSGQPQGYITYESLANTAISSVLHHTEKYCFSKPPRCRDRYLQGETLVVEDVNSTYSHIPCLKRFLHQAQVKSKLVSPILVGHQLWGLLIAHQCVNQRRWQPWEIEFLNHIAEHLAIAINQAQLYQQLQQQTQNLEICVVERTQDLRDALVAAQSANRAKSDFLATMSHELRTPLTYIIGMSATLLRWSLGDLSQRQRDYLNTIHTSGEHLLGLINDILEVSKVESGRMTLELRSFSLTSLSRQSIDAFRSEALSQGIDMTLDLKLAPHQDDFVADPRRVRQILSNLLSNAVKFTPAQGKVILRVRRDHQGVLFHIEDTGIGIPETAQALLFQKFQQIGNVRQREYSGTGLGLALTQQLVDLHGGSIKVTSHVGVGSIFTVRLPLQRLPDPTPLIPPLRKEPVGGASYW
ncbi:MAG: ATP-binding protein [Nodosilinea sp. LVE1205-7]|jgi:two-component system sensor histidine kinase/response regulator